MKKLLTTLAAVLVGIVATPNTAEAGTRISIGSGHTYISSHASCGCPIYTKRVVRGYNSHRRPIYNYYRQPFNCGCRRTASHASVVRHGYRSRNLSRNLSRSHSSSNSRHISSSRGRSSNR